MTMEKGGTLQAAIARRGFHYMLAAITSGLKEARDARLKFACFRPELYARS